MILVSRCLRCNEPIAQTAGRGRPRLFCSDACRKAAHRARSTSAPFTVLAAPAPRELDAALELPDEVLALPSDPDEAVVVTVREAWALVGRLARCGERARPQLAWRCERAGHELAEILGRLFTAEGSP